MYGVRGSPKRSEDRHLSKVFDHGRVKAKEVEGTLGCDEIYDVRDLTMKVGSCTRGGLKTLQQESTARKEQRILNIDKKCKNEK